MADKTLSELGYDSCILASMIEGLDALYQTADGHEDCRTAKHARNALPSMIDACIAKAWELNEALHKAELAQRA